MKKKLLRVLIIVVVLILIIPVSMSYKDGGTTTFRSLSYIIIKWQSMDDDYEGDYKTGTEIHFFPNNFKGLDDYS